MPTYRVLYNMTSRRFMDPADVVNLGDYKEITTVTANGPDDVFNQMNAIKGIELCCQLQVRSMSVGDLIQNVLTEEVTGCCGCGWKEVRFA
jgi:hypothetical protein